MAVCYSQMSRTPSGLRLWRTSVLRLSGLALLLEQKFAVEHGVGANICIPGRRLDFGDLACVGGKPAHANFQFDGVIVREFVRHDAGEHEFEAWSTGDAGCGCNAVILR